jgi:hypothetical protein
VHSLARMFLSLCLVLGLTNSAVLPSRADPAQAVTAAAEVSRPDSGAGRYVPLAAPVRMLDTQTGIGTPAVTSVPAEGTVPVKFTGRNGIPATGVAALQMNIVTGNTTAAGTMFTWPVGGSRPSAPNFYFYVNTGFTSSSAVVRLSATGEANFQNWSQGTLRILGEVTGYYTTADSQVAGTRFVPLRQSRVIDTRSKIGVGTTTPVPTNTAITVAIASKGGLPAAPSIASAVLSITAWQPAKAGGWIAYAGGATTPSAYFGNFAPGVGTAAGKPYTNTGVVKLSTDGRLALYNVSTGTTHYTVDVVGYFVADTSAAASSTRVVPVASQRLLDTGTTLVNPNVVTTVQVAGKAGLPASGIAFAALHVTAIGSATSGETVAYPPNEARPTGVTDVSWPISGNASYNLIWARVGPAGTVSLVNGTNAGIHYYVDIQAYAVAPGLPQAPINVTGGARDRAVEVRWDAPTDTGDLPIVGYDVLTTPGSTTTTSATNSVVVSGLTNGTPYTFKVRARTAAGASAYSTPTSPVTPAVPQVLGAPFITSAKDRDSGARLTWAAPEGAADQVATYEISTVPATSVVSVDGDSRTGDIYGLTNGQTYTVVVSAKNANGATPSAGAKVTPAPADLAMKPAALEVYPLDRRLDLQWVEPTDGGSPVLDYEVLAEPGAERLVIPAGTTVAALTGLANGTQYAVKVRARTRTGSGAWAESSATPTASRVPDAPMDLQVSPVSAGTLKVTWSAPTDSGTSAVSGYRVTVQPGARVVETTGTAIDVGDLAADTEYAASVQAINASGASAATEPSRPVRAAVVVKQAAVVLSADSLARIAAVGEEYLSFSSTNPQLKALKQDDLVIATPSQATPGGLLRKVLRVDDRDSQFVLQTEDAALDQVLSEGAATRDLSLHSSDVESLENAPPGVTLKSPTINGRSMRDGARFGTQTAGKLKVSLHDTTVVISLDGDIGPGVNLEGTAEADLRSDLDFDFRPGAMSAHFKATADTKLDFRAKVAYTQKLSKRKELGTVPGPPLIMPVGATPIVVVPQVVIAISWDAEGRAGLVYHVAASRRIGAKVDFTEGWTAPDVDGINEEIAPPEKTVTAFGSVESTFGLAVDFAVQVYGIIGPTMTIRPYLKFEADTEKNPFWEIHLGVEVGAGLRLDFLRRNLLRWVKNDVLQFEYQLANSGGPATGLLIDPGGVGLAVGEKQTFTSSIRGYPDAPVTWGLRGPGHLTPDATYTALADGVATITATVPADLGRPELTAEVPVIVQDHAPTEPTNLVVTPGNYSALVSWQPPEHDGGNPVTGYVATTEPDTGEHRVSATTKSVVIGGLQAGTSYAVTVYALSGELRGDGATAAPIVARPSVLANPFANDLMRGLTGSSNAIGPELSDSGRYAFFPLQVGPDEVPPAGIPNDGQFYLVRRDLETGFVELASRQADGVTPQSISAPRDRRGNPNPTKQADISSSADGRYVAYLVDDGSARRRVMVYDFVQHTVWSASTGVAEDIVQIALSASGSVVAATTELEVTTNRYRNNVFRMVKGGATKRVDMCTSAAVCDSAYAKGLSADGGTVIYTFYVSSAQSPYYNHENLHVFYNAATGAATMPYYNSDYMSFWELQMSRNGQYFVAQAWVGSFDNPETVLVTKRVGTGPVTEADIFQRGYAFENPGMNLSISDDGNFVAWVPGQPHAGSAAGPAAVSNRAFLTLNRATGVQREVWNIPLLQVYGGFTGMSMSAGGRLVAWTPDPSTPQSTPMHPAAQQLG